MKKIAIAIDENKVAEHFGRCPFYLLIEISGKKIINQEKISNPGHRTGFLPGFLAQKEVKTIISGGMGKKALDLFAEEGIEVICGVNGEINDVIEKYLNGELLGNEFFCQPGAGKGYGIAKEEHKESAGCDKKVK